MKTLITILGLILGLQTLSSQPMREEKIIEKVIPVTLTDDFGVKISNINGDVEVYAIEKNEVKINLRITVKADDREDIEKGIRELSLKEQLKDGTLTLSMDAPFIIERWRNGEIIGTQIEDCPDYDYRYDFRVGIPKKASLKAGTVNGGDVFIEGVQGTIKANNVNGSIEITDVMEVKVANTVNGSIRIDYLQNPSENGYFHTINGDITLKLKEDLNATVNSKSMNGDLYSSYNFEYLKPTVEMSQKSNRRGTTYKINEKTGISIGTGGPELTLETLNGNMYLKKS